MGITATFVHNRLLHGQMVELWERSFASGPKVQFAIWKVRPNFFFDSARTTPPLQKTSSNFAHHLHF
jgi:hypothetical protein